MELFFRLADIAADPDTYARQWKAASQSQVIGHMCSYTPEELIVAAGALPFRIFGSSGTISLADAHLQSYCCSVVRTNLEDALSASLAFVDGTLFTHTCDSIQRLSDIWRRNTSFKFHLDFMLPVKLNTGSARSYTMEVLARLKQEMEAVLQVTITPDDLRKAIQSCNQVRRLLKRLYELKRIHPGIVSGRHVQAAFKSAMIMDKTEFIAEMSGILNALVEPAQEDCSNGKRLVLAGGTCMVPDLFQMIEDSGGVVVGDDLCSGARYFEGMVDEQADALTALADHIISRPLCPAKHAGLSRRLEGLLKLVENSQAQGVVIVVMKFCDPHGFDIPYLTSALQEKALPYLVLELEGRLAVDGQWRTRIEAFLEML